MGAAISLLGPQRPVPNLKTVLDRTPSRGPFVVITAGWRQDETEIGALQAHLGTKVHLLPLYRWFDEVTRAEPALHAEYKARQGRIRAYKKLYQVRVQANLEVVRELWKRQAAPATPDAGDLVTPALAQSLAQVREIDSQALTTVTELHEQATAVEARFENPTVASVAAKVAHVIAKAGVVLIAGGHVGVLRNRLRFFGAHHALRDRAGRGQPIVAWGGGTMVLSERIVLYYDDPPDGEADPEILDRGMGLAGGAVFFPHARERLRLSDRARMAAMARRFAPDQAIALENGAWIQAGPAGWHSLGDAKAAQLIAADGALAPLPPPPVEVGP